jgi:16S rRNA (guanine966-N2)-methyltransferase
VSSLRVVGGASRGRRLLSPVVDGVRPTSDRVREAIFDILGSILDLDGLRVADLFAGTGAMGIEALSRGAGSVTFVESDERAASSVRANLVSTGLEGPNATVLRRDVIGYLPTVAVPFDLALCDPPYSFTGWDELLRILPADLAVLESGAQIVVPEPWMIIRQRRYGSTLVTVVRGAQDRQGGPA